MIEKTGNRQPPYFIGAGNYSILESTTIGVVGSRNASTSSLDSAFQLVKLLHVPTFQLFPEMPGELIKRLWKAPCLMEDGQWE
jgi:hypothetical protein